jgi:hypothetical protein
MNEYIRELARLIRNPDREIGMVVDPETLEVEHVFVGGPGNIDFQDADVAGKIALHSHPRRGIGPFSPPDLAFADINRAHATYVVSADGMIYEMVTNGRYTDHPMWLAIFVAEGREVYDHIQSCAIQRYQDASDPQEVVKAMWEIEREILDYLGEFAERHGWTFRFERI